VAENSAARLIGISAALVETVPSDIFAANPALAVAAVVQQSFAVEIGFELNRLYPVSGCPH
jgi:hypothetical protein